MACLNWEIPPVHYMLANLSDEARVPVARYATYGTEELARSAATLWLESREPVKVLQEILGHSRIDVTMNVYTHVLPQADLRLNLFHH